MVCVWLGVLFVAVLVALLMCSTTLLLCSGGEKTQRNDKCMTRTKETYNETYEARARKIGTSLKESAERKRALTKHKLQIQS